MEMWNRVLLFCILLLLFSCNDHSNDRDLSFKVEVMNTQQCFRPARAKAYIIGAMYGRIINAGSYAFALAGRKLGTDDKYPGGRFALPWAQRLLGLQPAGLRFNLQPLVQPYTLTLVDHK